MKNNGPLILALFFVFGLIVLAFNLARPDDQANLIAPPPEREKIALDRGLWEGDVFSLRLPGGFSQFSSFAEGRSEGIAFSLTKGRVTVRALLLLPGQGLGDIFPDAGQREKVSKVAGYSGFYSSGAKRDNFLFVDRGVFYQIEIFGKKRSRLLEKIIKGLKRS